MAEEATLKEGEVKEGSEEQRRGYGEYQTEEGGG